MEFFERGQTQQGPQLRDIVTSILFRFWLTLVVVLAVGILFYRGSMFQRMDPAFQFISIGALATAILTFVRVRSPTVVLALVLGFGMFRLGLVQAHGWLVGASGMFLGAGLYLVALIYDLLVASRWRIGKCLVTGPLMAGVFLALAPLLEFHSMNLVDAGSTLIRHSAVGLGIGIGVGLGMELAELVLGFWDHEKTELTGKTAPPAAEPNR